MIFRRITLFGLVLLLWSSLGAAARPDPSAAAIASAHPLATNAGREIIEGGGNAFDAAIAVAAALAVVEPYSSGIGGGGFFLLHRAVSNSNIFLDARERAPIAATKDMYLDAKGEVIPNKSLNGALAAAIPGTPAALVHLALNYGRLPLERSLAPAIKLAREGFPVSEHYRAMASFRKDVMLEDPATAEIFLHRSKAPAIGYVLKQRDLAATLERLTTEGTAGFYAGETADLLVQGNNAGRGIWTLEDLAQYRVVEREPLIGHYHDMEIISAPPPSSGGVVMLEALNMLENFELASLGSNDRRHLTIEAMRRAYRDRAEFLGDPDFTALPVTELIDKGHASAIGADITLERATPSSALKPISPPKQGDHTTHFSILDIEGNRVAATLSVNYPFGACFTPPGTGVLLNNEMDDFSSRALTPNAYGLVGVDANAIAPGKRPLSSMTPSFLVTKNRIAILGTPGGSRIISMVLLGALEFYAGSGPEAWVGLPRYHHQYLPDEVLYEPKAFDEATIADLKARGHTLKLSSRDYGNMHAILWDLTTNEVTAASDPRGEGLATVWAARLPQIKPAKDAAAPQDTEVEPAPAEVTP
jgi:gamma-glutamyltranspeptidase / glutathione hydrolase